MKSNETFNLMRELAGKQRSVRRIWVTDEKTKTSLKDFAANIDSNLLYVEGNPYIIAKETKKGVFNKMHFDLQGGGYVEYDLKYKNDFEEDDVIDISTVCFYVETYLENKHLYVTGELLDE